MRIILNSNATAHDVAVVIGMARDVTGSREKVRVDQLDGRVVINVLLNGEPFDPTEFNRLDCVETVDESETVYVLAGSTGIDPDTGDPRKIPVEIPSIDVSVGGHDFIIMAGPCAVENEDDLMLTARIAKESGAKLLRGGAFKPRTSPYSFQGLGDDGLKILSRVRAEIGIGIITEAMEPGAVGKVGEVSDVIQIGSRNMQNFPLLLEVGRQSKPVLLKRGMSATLDEWLGAAEYILNEGNPNVILCERGIRTFSRHSRHTLDIGVIPAIRERSGLPVIVDPSHSTGSSSRVPAMAKAAIAAGADGLLVEIHPHPNRALSDSFQTLSHEEFNNLMFEMKSIAKALGRGI